MNNDGGVLRLAALGVSGGLASGEVFLYRGSGDTLVPERTIDAADVPKELDRLAHARDLVRRDLESLSEKLRERVKREDVQVFESHIMILEDPILSAEAERLVTEEHVNAESAVKQCTRGMRENFERMNDQYFRERLLDLDEVQRRLIKSLTGFSERLVFDFHTPVIVVAESLSPGELMQLPREFVLGIATDGGSATDHVALLSRAIGLPVVAGLREVTSLVKPGDTMLLDGTAGEVVVNPTKAELDAFEHKMRQKRLFMASERASSAPGTLADGSHVLVFANVHPGFPYESVRDAGLGGIGLYRSEYLWLNAGNSPSEEEQLKNYREAAEFVSTISPESTVTIRTLDIGGDKLLAGMCKAESNPFLGHRSIRYLLDNRDLFKTQLRAILRSSAFGRVCMMHPMISCVEELDAANAILAEVKEELSASGIAFDRAVPVGMMIEVPSAALNAAAFADKVDFFSIGTNDLVQYTMAADRSNEAVAKLYQPSNPAVVELVSRVITAGHAAGTLVSVCGESASDPVLGALWVALGADMLSMSVACAPAVAALLRRMTRTDLNDYARYQSTLDRGIPAAETYAKLKTWLKERFLDDSEVAIV